MKPQYIEVIFDGSKYYHSDKAMTVLHREDGPAVEFPCGYKSWYRNGKYHREDGPAIEFSNGDKRWYINDELLSEAEFKARKSPCNGKKVIVDGIEYTLKA